MRDHARAGFDIALAAVPTVGGPAQMFLEALFAPAIQKRRDRWFARLEEVIVELQARVANLDPDALAENEEFVSAVMEASRIAMGTHLEAKLDLLKNCLINLGLGNTNGHFLDRQMFKWVEDLSPEHFLVLQYLSNPRGWYDTNGIPDPSFYMGSPMNLLEAADLPVKGHVLDIVLTELNSRRLIDSGSIGTGMTAQGMWQSLTLPLGRQLLDFVRDV
jgi:hypothetical protein